MYDNIVILVLGSNLGNSQENILRACRFLPIYCKKVSSIYLTRPLLKDQSEQQPNYLNLAISGYYQYQPLKLLRITQDIELMLGKKRNPKKLWDPREIDIDIALFGSLVKNSDELRIPHPGIEEYRNFFLVPACEIYPGFTVPSNNMNLQKMARPCNYVVKRPSVSGAFDD